MDDWELLNSYAAGSEAAFNDLLRRHINHVYSTALRRTHDPELAQDITHRVFCLLARKASLLSPTGSLVGWLHRTACNLASESLRADRRRRAREAEALRLNPMSHESATDETWHQVAPHLDDALLDLPEPDRLAILLRFFQRLPLREVGLQLGVSEAAAKMRIGRAVLRLRRFLGVRGITLTAGALVWLLTDKAVVAAPSGCMGSITAAVAATAVGTALSPLAALLAPFSKISAPTSVVAGMLLLATVGTVALLKPSANREANLGNSGTVSDRSESNFDAKDVNPSVTPDLDPLLDPEQLDQAIARLREAIREPFRRTTPRDRIQKALAALGRQARFALPMVMQELRVALNTDDLSGFNFSIQILALESLRQIGPEARETLPELIRLLREGKLAAHNDSIVELFTALQPSPEQIGELANQLTDPGVVPSNSTAELVVRLLEVHPDAVATNVESLQAGLAGAEPNRQLILALTLARLSGSDPEQLRPILEKSLLLPELRDPNRYLPTTQGPYADRSREQPRMIDDGSRNLAVRGLVALGDGARDSLPALEELVRLTPNVVLRDRALRAIGFIDPKQQSNSSEVGAAVVSWEVDQIILERVSAGIATTEELRSGLTSVRTLRASAMHIATLGDAGRQFVPDLMAALNRTGSQDAAQTLKQLAPRELIRCLQNPAAFTAEEPVDRWGNPSNRALMAAAQALGDLGPNAAFALPALREALEIPDKNWVRDTLEKVIHEIDPQAPVSLFRGKPLEHAANTLVRARDQARLVGNVERAQLADRIAHRISPIYGMTQRELLAIAADLQAADPELHAIYVQALGEADPIVGGHLAPAP